MSEKRSTIFTLPQGNGGTEILRRRILWSSSCILSYHPADLPPYGRYAVCTRILTAALSIVVENWNWNVHQLVANTSKFPYSYTDGKHPAYRLWVRCRRGSWHAIIHSLVCGKYMLSDDIWKDTQELVAAPGEGTERLGVMKKTIRFEFCITYVCPTFQIFFKILKVNNFYK